MKPLRCVFGIHGDMGLEFAYPIYRKTCKVCGDRWVGIANGAWKKMTRRPGETEGG